MYKLPNTLAVLAIFLVISVCHSQNNDLQLSKQSISEIIDSFYTVEDSLLKRSLASEVVNIGYKEADTAKILTGFFLLATSSKDFSQRRFADSLIYYGTLRPNKNYPGVGHLLKGDSFFSKNKFKSALDAYLQAYNYSKENKNPDLSHVISYNIGVLKIRAGDFTEAKAILQDYFKSEKTQKANGQFLQACYGLADVYNRLGVIDSSRYYQKMGLERAESLDNEEMISYLKLAESQSDYRDSLYQKSRSTAQKVLDYFKDKGDRVLLAEIYNLIGQSYWQTGRNHKAIDYLKKVDTIFNIENDLFPSEREAYPVLINYHSEEDQLEKKLYYINQLLRLDSIIYSNSNYLKSMIYSDYTTDRLLEQKNTILSKLENEKRLKKYLTGAIILLVIAFIGWIVYSTRRSAKNKKAFKKLIAKMNEKIPSTENTTDQKSSSISTEITKDILSKLESFEAEKAYLNSSITLQKLAKNINTNTKYLSAVINENKGSSFSNYLNGLRVNYAISKLKNNRKFRNYTIKAIASESGFNNAESFSRAFAKITQLKPSYFIKEIKKSELQTVQNKSE